jgi:DNA polymerase-3 subunit epsilon
MPLTSSSRAPAAERIAIVDVETTGLATRNGGRVIEVGAVVVEAGAVVAEFGSLIKVAAPIHYGAERVHGISSAMLQGEPQPDQVWPRFLDFVGNASLVAHNYHFDKGFILHELSLLGLQLPNHWHCTLHLARKLLPGLDNHRLATVATALLGEIPADCRLHRALGDARLTALVWLELRKRG